VDSLGIYHAPSATFFLRNSNSAGPADLMFSYGWPGATPLVGDWDGNGTDTVGVYDSGSATFFLRNSNSAGAASTCSRMDGAGPHPWSAIGTATAIQT